MRSLIARSPLPHPRWLPLGLTVGLLGACNSDFTVVEGVSRLVVTPEITDLGPIGVGQEQSFGLELVASRGEVSVLAVDVFNVDGDAYSLIPGELPTVGGGSSATLGFVCAPTEAGWPWAEITLTTDETRDNVHTVTVRAEALLASARAWPGLVEFGPVAAGSSAEASLTLVNEGGLDLTLSAATFDDSAFTLVDALPLDLAAADSRALTLRYTAPDAAERLAAVSLDLGLVTVGPIPLQANACSQGGGPLYDQDGDGVSVCADDCDDTDAGVRPGLAEDCDGLDNDCDGTVDEGTSCADDDGDGYSEDDGDCNDGDAEVHPKNTEVMDNGIDDDCDGTADAGGLDFDNDGYSESAGDCDDGDATAYPGAAEAADGVDNDCDGSRDEGTGAYDDDGDGFTEKAGDCDDSDATVYTGAKESPDYLDNDCDGDVDEGTVYADDDGDGFTETGGDCNDANANINPGAYEVVGDGTDNDCDGVKK